MGMKIYCSNHDKLSFEILESTWTQEINRHRLTFCIYVFHTLKRERNMLIMKDLTFSAFYTEIFGGADFITTLMENIFCNVFLVSQEYVN